MNPKPANVLRGILTQVDLYVPFLQKLSEHWN